MNEKEIIKFLKTHLKVKIKSEFIESGIGCHTDISVSLLLDGEEIDCDYETIYE